MAGLQRSSLSFRRQGSSGFVWDDRFLSGELNRQQVTQGQENPEEIIMVKEVKPLRPIKTVQRSRSNGGGRGYRSSPAIEPPSPKVSACGLCGGFGKSSRNNNINAVRGANPGKRGRPRY